MTTPSVSWQLPLPVGSSTASLLSLPGYFCHEIRGKKEILTSLSPFFFFPCKASGAGPAPPLCCAQQPRVPRKETQQGHLPLAPAAHSLATGPVGHAGSPSSAMPNEGTTLRQESLPQSWVMTWGHFVTACNQAVQTKPLLLSPGSKQEIFDGLKSKSSFCGLRVRARVHAGTGEPSRLEES